MTERADYPSEAHLQEIVYNDPEIIPIQDITAASEMSTIKLPIKEVAIPGSGSIDILGLDEFGNIYIIETKLARNQEAKRMVIGQVLEYAAFLHGKHLDDFNQIVKNRIKQDLVQYLEDKVENWDKEKFQENLQNNLTEGIFKLFIVVDEINESLKRTINYMNSQLNVEIYALELRYFRDQKGTEILVPTVYGSKMQHPSTKPPFEWDQTSFFADAAERVDPPTLNTIRKFYDFGNEIGEITFGTGRTFATFRVHIPCKDDSVKLFTITSKGSGNWISFARLVEKRIDTRIIKDYIIALKSLGFPFDEERHLSKHPEFGIDILNRENVFGAFKEATIKLIKNLQSDTI